MILKWQKSSYSSRRANLQQEDSNEDSTSIILTSLSLILVAFFVYLCHLSGSDNARQAEVLSHIRNQFFGGLSQIDLGPAFSPTDTQQDQLAPAFLLEAAGFIIEKLPQGFRASAPHGMAFTTDNRIRPKIIRALQTIAGHRKISEFNILALVYQDEAGIAESLGKVRLLGALKRQGALERSLIDLGFKSELISCFVSLAEVNAELIIELQE